MPDRSIGIAGSPVLAAPQQLGRAAGEQHGLPYRA
jgi:hypothetical protein